MPEGDALHQSFFPEAELERLNSAYESVGEFINKLAEPFLIRPYKTDKGRVNAHHGFVRRLSILKRSIETVFELIPPNLSEIPSRDVVGDATIHLHAFVLNVFGAVDNLAWVWVSERGLKDAKDKPIPDTWVGLRPSNTLIRESFSEQFRTELRELDAWFGYLIDFRDSLSHRIPLYIPPFVVINEHVEAYNKTERKAVEALQHGDLNEHHRLNESLRKFAVFRPWMMHTLNEAKPAVVFHPQMLTDVHTLDVIGRGILRELDSLRD
ncbi:hypothetical protein [Methylobacterium sp. WL6]|uniref:hypothetical protein n=1 Tax=Methylobacterium sp. WL6 TaxID=2603901 RepID=UPI0011C81683|nr:hypothetical protein [Methylobacterium sp. WL6]TXN73415.1 hypothetical protein FV230_01190 [Methylobacterium sp. WL6]